MSMVVTANTLATGRVVFLGANGGWVETIADAHQFPDAAAADEGLEQAKLDAERAIIVEPFVAEAGHGDGSRPMMTLRDTIRAYGPTIRFVPGADTAKRV